MWMSDECFTYLGPQSALTGNFLNFQEISGKTNKFPEISKLTTLTAFTIHSLQHTAFADRRG